MSDDSVSSRTFTKFMPFVILFLLNVAQSCVMTFCRSIQFIRIDLAVGGEFNNKKKFYVTSNGWIVSTDAICRERELPEWDNIHCRGPKISSAQQ